MVQTLKARMRERENLAGCFIMLPSSAVVEMAGYAGFDFVILDTDHGADTSETLEHQLRAADASGISALVRTNSINPGRDPSRARRWCRWHRFPHVRTSADAESIASAALYPPYGCRGIATTGRAGRHGFTSVAEHLSRAYGSTIVLP
ncbi:MAG: 2-dehydro-3-deoxyglucarate aldolase [Roseomonas sp.]|nr:2-dehydro-3-deoxyglucarate aldolase [Roseomonas sp.]